MGRWIRPSRSGGQHTPESWQQKSEQLPDSACASLARKLGLLIPFGGLGGLVTATLRLSQNSATLATKHRNLPGAIREVPGWPD